MLRRPADAVTWRVLAPVFAATGFSALTFQVVWQRVLSIHAGVDLFSSTTIVAAFMAGLGLGSLLGGVVADRVGPRGCVLAFAASNAGIALFGWQSVSLFYRGYQALVPRADSVGAAFAFHFALLCVPTTLMGLSLPLLARGAVRALPEAALRVGRLYAVNTLGAALGAAISGWWLLGRFGFVATSRFASLLNLFAALITFALWRAAPASAPLERAPSAQTSSAAAPRTWPWFLIYGFTGAIALGLEIVYFRVVDAIMRSNSYTFGHVLTLYLLLFAAGAAVGSRRAQSSSSPEKAFVWLQFGVGFFSLLGLFVLVNLPPAFGMRGMLERYFATDGYLAGPEFPASARSAQKLVFAHLTGPLLVMGAPVFLMGASYPFAMALVARNMETLGRRTGLLMFCNICGNVIGTLVVGFVLLDQVGTAGTLRLLSALLVLPVGAAALFARLGAGRWRIIPASIAMLGLVLAFPSNVALWRFFHSARAHDFALVEERTCVNALVKGDREQVLFLNATSQNGYPYDDFHILIGLLPALMHPAPQRAMSVGLGIGSTSYGLLQDARLREVHCVEICRGEKDLLGILAARGSTESRQLLDDGRLTLHFGDGRKFLLQDRRGFDVIVEDALRPNSAYSGNLYSLEFYQLVRSRLRPSGLFSQWVPTRRVRQTAAQVFSHLITVEVPGGRGSFLVASDSPLPLDRAELIRRFSAAQMHQAFRPEQRAAILRFLETVQPHWVRRGEPVRPLAESELNFDLHPRDEYFLNNG